MSVFRAVAKQGQLSLGSDANKARFLEDVKNNEGATYRIERQKPVRSLSQNNYYWLYLGLVEAETGNDRNELHSIFKRKFLPVTVKQLYGETFAVTSSTRNLDKIAFGEYLDKISALTGVPLPDPKDAGFLV